MAVDYISALNAGSGLNTTQIIDSLIDAERAPREAANSRKNRRCGCRYFIIRLDSKLSYTFNTNAEHFLGRMAYLIIVQYSICVTKTGLNRLPEFSHSIEVAALAEAQVLQFSGFSTATDRCL